MTLFQAPILTNGSTHSAQQFRMLVRDLARGAEGITQGDDLKVAALGTPGASVTVGDGSGVVRGRANTFQGSYAVCNIGSATVAIASTGGSVRSDMLILRVEDPQYEGSLNPATDPIMYFQIISGVSSTATAIPDGRTGIPLARIDIPASTSTITNAYIKDIRKVANGRRERTLFTESPASPSPSISGTSVSFVNFSTALGWSVPVPDWATTVKIKLDVGQIRYATGNVFGYLRGYFGASLVTQSIAMDDNQGTGVRRSTLTLADTLTVPSGYRGTSQTLRLQGTGGPGNAGTILVDTSTTIIGDVEFVEAPR